MPCTNPTEGAAPVSDSSSATTRCAGDDLHRHQVHRERGQVGAGPDRPGPGPVGPVGGVDLPAAALDPVLVLLGDRDPDLRDLVLLGAVDHSQITGPGQVVPAVTAALGEPVTVITRVAGPPQMRSRHPRTAYPATASAHPYRA